MKKEMKVVLYVLIFSGSVFAAEPACPVCSKYHFEEMLLERVLRNELDLEQTLKDIKETNTKVVDALKKLQNENDIVNTAIELMERKQISMEAILGDSIKTALTNASKSMTYILTESEREIKEMEDKVDGKQISMEATFGDIIKTALADMSKSLSHILTESGLAIKKMEGRVDRKQISMEARLDDAIQTALTNVSQSLSHILTESERAIKEMEGRVERFNGDLKTPTLQFRAQLSSSISLNGGLDVVFARVEINEGQGYNTGTGKFTAPVAGLYNFAVHYCAQHNQLVFPEIVHNGMSLLKAFNQGQRNEELCSSLHAYVVMSVGDMVWVRTTSKSIFTQNDSRCFTTFSGVLIRA